MDRATAAIRVGAERMAASAAQQKLADAAPHFAGDGTAARQARTNALECIDAAPRDWGILRQRIEALRLK